MSKLNYKKLRNAHVKLKRNHECKTLREFEKILRKYGRFAFMKKIWYSWNIYYIADKSRLSSEEFIKYSNKRKNLPLIRAEVLDAIEKDAACELKGKEYILYGVLLTNEDYYYIFKSEDCKLLESCVGHLNDAGDKFYYKK